MISAQDQVRVQKTRNLPLELSATMMAKLTWSSGKLRSNPKTAKTSTVAVDNLQARENVYRNSVRCAENVHGVVDFALREETTISARMITGIAQPGTKMETAYDCRITWQRVARKAVSCVDQRRITSIRMRKSTVPDGPKLATAQRIMISTLSALIAAASTKALLPPDNRITTL